jgi:ATP-dependent protease ClpP protease subunit
MSTAVQSAPASAAAPAKRVEIKIYDVIGPDWFGDGITAKRIKEQLDQAGDVDAIDVRVNSPGGSVWDGWAIYNLLSQHKASVHVHVDGIALSAASIIAMAGDEILMAENAMMMIHETMTIVMGNATDLEKEAGVLRKWNDSAVGVYAARTGQAKEAIAGWMAAETWFPANEAVEKGFAAGITKNKAKAATTHSSHQVAQLVGKFKHIPDAAKALLISISNHDHEGVPTMSATATNTAPAQTSTATAQAAAGQLKGEVLTLQQGEPLLPRITEEDVKKAATEAAT